MLSKYILENPEIIRHKNVNFRKSKFISLTSIYLLMMFIIYFIIYLTLSGKESIDIFKILYAITMGIQYISIFYVGTYLVVTSIFQERDKETFDFLRMSTIDRKVLSVGKLLGPNIFIYFLVLLMTPLIVLFSVLGDIPIHNLLGSYLNIFLFGILYHSIGLFFGITLPNTKTNSAAGLAIGLPIFSNFLTMFSASPYINPFYSLFSMFSNKLDVSKFITFYSYPFPDFLITFVIISWIIFWCMVFIVRKIDYDQNKIMTKKQSIYFTSSFQFILLGLSWNLFLSEMSGAIYMFMTINIFLQLLITSNLTPDKDDTIVWLNKDNSALSNIFDEKASIIGLTFVNSIIVLASCFAGSLGDFVYNGKFEGFIKSLFMFIPFIMFSIMYSQFFYLSKLIFTKKQSYFTYAILFLSLFIPIPITGITKGSQNIVESFLINPLIFFASMTYKSNFIDLITFHNIVQFSIIGIIILILGVIIKSKKDELKKKYVV